MSAYVDLCESVNSRVTDVTQTFPHVEFVVDPREDKILDYPSLQTFWESTETVEVDHNVQRLLVTRDVYFVTLSRVKRSTAEEALQEIYSIHDELKSIISGYQPIVDTVFNTWPISPMKEEFFEISGGELGIYILWKVRWQEQTNVNSEIYS